jgi:hypothetical protein
VKKAKNKKPENNKGKRRIENTGLFQDAKVMEIITPKKWILLTNGNQLEVEPCDIFIPISRRRCPKDILDYMRRNYLRCKVKFNLGYHDDGYLRARIIKVN